MQSLLPLFCLVSIHTKRINDESVWKIIVQVKTLTGRQQTFNFEPSAKVLEVKNALQEREGIQVDQIRLIFGGRQMSDEHTLEFYNVQPGAVIHMVLQLRGGRDS